MASQEMCPSRSFLSIWRACGTWRANRGGDIFEAASEVVAPYRFFSFTDKSEEVFTISSATALLPGQDKASPSRPLSGASCIVVSCGFRLSEVGLSEFRKPQVTFYLASIGPLLSLKHRDSPGSKMRLAIMNPRLLLLIGLAECP
jgi:hypothetical protein